MKGLGELQIQRNSRGSELPEKRKNRQTHQDVGLAIFSLFRQFTSPTVPLNNNNDNNSRLRSKGNSRQWSNKKHRGRERKEKI